MTEPTQPIELENGFDALYEFFRFYSTRKESHISSDFINFLEAMIVSLELHREREARKARQKRSARKILTFHDRYSFGGEYGRGMVGRSKGCS